MTVATSTRRFFIAAAIFALFAAIGVAAMHLAAQLLRTSVEHALGPEIRFDRLRVGLTNLEITGAEVRAPQGWPTLNTLSAKRVVVVPDLRDLMSGQVVIDRAIFAHAFITALRTNEDGAVRVLPGILDQPGTIVAGGSWAKRPSHGVLVGSIDGPSFRPYYWTK
jgi:hypothetical protein